MVEHEDIPIRTLHWQFNQLTYWLPLVPFTVPAGFYHGAIKPDTNFIVVGNSRRELSHWQQAMTGLPTCLVVINTAGLSLSEAIAEETVTVETLLTAVAQLPPPDVTTPETETLTESGEVSPLIDPQPLPHPICLPLTAEYAPHVEELASLTGRPCRLLPPHPPAATAALRAAPAPPDSATLPAWPVAFNLALFMSLLTFCLSLTFGSAYSWLWFLLPWLAVAPVAILPPSWRYWSGLVRGLGWGIILAIPLVAWQGLQNGWPAATAWAVAALLLCGWAGWRADIISCNLNTYDL